MNPREDNRERLAFTLSPAVARILVDISEVLGIPKTAIVTDALNQALPLLLEQSDAFRKRARELQHADQIAAPKAKK
jgi:hypothetical protein